MALKNLGGPEAEPSHDFCLRKVQFFWLSVFSFGFCFLFVFFLCAVRFSLFIVIVQGYRCWLFSFSVLVLVASWSENKLCLPFCSCYFPLLPHLLLPAIQMLTV